MLWFAVVFVVLVVMFLSLYFPLFKDSSALMAILIISGLIGLFLIAKQTNQGVKSWKFIQEARLELYKIVWPTRQEMITSTLLVIGITIIASVMIYFIGLLFMYLMQWILR